MPEVSRRPKRSLGQNFLVDPNYKRKIIEAISPSLNDEILEIGPGRGVLTEELVGRCQHLWVVEKDKNLFKELIKKYADEPKITILNQDILEVDFENYWGEPPWEVKAIGNLPYNVSSQIFISLLEKRHYFTDFYFMFQKEVAQRLIAKPGTKDYSLFTLWSQIYTDCEIFFHIKPPAFRPRPKVDSSFVHFKIKHTPLLKDDDADFFWKLVRHLFQHRRKTIRGALKGANLVDIKKVEKSVSKNARAETFSPEELINLAQELHDNS